MRHKKRSKGNWKNYVIWLLISCNEPFDWNHCDPLIVDHRTLEIQSISTCYHLNFHLKCITIATITSINFLAKIFIMQRSLRMNDLQLFALADKALHDNSKKGYLFKRTTEGSKWQLRWFVLYQNLFFYYDSESSGKPCGLIFLEGSYCSKAIQTGSSKNSTHLQVNPENFNPKFSLFFSFFSRHIHKQLIIMIMVNKLFTIIKSLLMFFHIFHRL